LKFSIVIPTYNEENDIIHTINSLKKLEHNSFEVIFVDDSNDKTYEILENNKISKFVLIKNTVRKDRSQARNIGIKSAKGEIIVILNADVILPPNFLKLVEKKYTDSQCDYLLVQSKVINLNSKFSRFIHCDHNYKCLETNWAKSWTWTEGFSIKKEVLMKTNLFPSGPKNIPITAGEDRIFGEELVALKAKKCIDLSIIVDHIAPSTFEEFWKIRKTRGNGGAIVKRIYLKQSYFKIIALEISKLLLFLIKFILILPYVIKCFNLTKYSNNNRLIETLLFLQVIFLEKLSFFYGSIKTTQKLMFYGH